MSKRFTPKSILLTVVVFGFFIGVAFCSDKPFWTEKSVFQSGQFLFAVGIASSVESVEKGRLIAFDNGVKEVENFTQMSDLSSITIDTQMTYEEKNLVGKINVYRLLKVDLDELSKAKKKQTKKSDDTVYFGRENYSLSNGLDVQWQGYLSGLQGDSKAQEAVFRDLVILSAKHRTEIMGADEQRRWEQWKAITSLMNETQKQELLELNRLQVEKLFDRLEALTGYERKLLFDSLTPVRQDEVSQYCLAQINSRSKDEMMALYTSLHEDDKQIVYQSLSNENKGQITALKQKEKAKMAVPPDYDKNDLGIPEKKIPKDGWIE